MTYIRLGPLPSHVILAIVRSSAFEGDITRNPYNFGNYSLQLTAGFLKVPENEFESVFNGTNVKGTAITREHIMFY